MSVDESLKSLAESSGLEQGILEEKADTFASDDDDNSETPIKEADVTEKTNPEEKDKDNIEQGD